MFFRDLYQTEIALTKVLFGMEQVGIKINRSFTEEALQYETERADKAVKEFQNITCEEFIDSGKHLAKCFDLLGYTYARTEKGNPSFTEENLSAHPSPLTDIILTIRDAHKRISTYYSNFLTLADDNDIIHTDFVQSGAATGRMSCKTPNLQNLTKEEETEAYYLVRRCFIPRDDYSFVMIDYDQMEYRLMLEYAEQMDVIEAVKQGMDVHEATANMMGTTRSYAKTINFMLLYGGGASKLAAALKLSLFEAKNLRELYFLKLPKINKFIKDVIRIAEIRGHIFNWRNRLCYIDRKFSYKAPNYLIQGGCADIVKAAMVKLSTYLEGKKSRMLLQIHDEILFEVHKDEHDIIPDLKSIMESVYPYKHLPMTCGVEWSNKSWQDKENYELL